MMDAMLFCCLIVAAMAFGLLHPGGSGRVVVFTGQNNGAASVYGLLSGTDGTLVEKLGDGSFVVESGTKGFVDQLYANGAFLVVKGNALYGCGTSKTKPDGTSVGGSPFRRNR